MFFKVYISICQGGRVFVNDEANELSISRSILSITYSAEIEYLTVIGGGRPRDAADWLTGRRIMRYSQ